MKRHHYDYDDVLVRTEDAMPICGEDFCDRCGDCLSCYGGDPCHSEHDKHFWVVYENDQ